MDLADSVKVSRDSTYSGYLSPILDFAYGALTLYDSAVPNGFRYRYSYLHKSYYPGSKMDPVWATPLSLAATHGIDFSFCSSGYCDVSVRQVRDISL